MTDYNTRYKLYPYRYIYTVPAKQSFTHRDLYRATNSQVLRGEQRGQPTAHDCREPIVKEYQDKQKWNSLILSYGLQATYDSVEEIHTRPPAGFDEIKPDKLLFHIGNSTRKTGSEKGEFSFPRGLTVTHSGLIVIADSSNHRIQVFNQFGVLVKSIGSFGTKNGEFNEPTGVASNMNEEVMVADSKNRRIQIFTRKWLYKDNYQTTDEPISIATDIYYNAIVATRGRTVEIYRRGGKLVNRFSTFPRKEIKSSVEVGLAVNEMMNTIIICDPADCVVKSFNYSGDLVSIFEPRGSADGLACRPAGLHVLLSGDVVIADILNHTVSLYSDKGELMRQLVGPTDGCGTVQRCAVGPEGHLITMEFSVNGIHCLKIYRFKDCQCHKFRPGSNKRTPTPKKTLRQGQSATS